MLVSILALAATVLAQHGCISSTGASISILSPAQAQAVNVGDNLLVSWNQVNSVAAFQNLSLSFSLSNATNPNNVIPIPGGALTSAKPVPVSAGQATFVIPNVPSSSKYAIEAQYQDVGTQMWMQCFSPVFEIIGPTAAPGVVVATTGAAAATTAAAKSGAGLVGVGLVGVVVVALGVI
ncbi:hypothetical protein HDU98_010925 [Podochytrium sp. JEL0797]|nr:hypothetical protein HDU98_010925 [Podochytrium sp. JEL0797]